MVRATGDERLGHHGSMRNKQGAAYFAAGVPQQGIRICSRIETRPIAQWQWTYVFLISISSGHQHVPLIKGRDLEADSIEWSHSEVLGCPLPKSGILLVSDKHKAASKA